MKRINLLDIDTSNKIAAGEVVERPSSVVKELLENSIDAEAKNITIEIKDGGEALIRIIDDGIGIHPQDIDKAFLPHATSKIKGAGDLFNITTMGFRGEALASIAAVSHTKLTSRTEDFDYGREIIVDGGTISEINDTGSNKGTIIEVRDLFFNVPARKKFLKSTSRESAIISDIVNKIALSNKDIAITFYNNGKKVLRTYGTGNITDCIRAVYDKDIMDNLIYFEGHIDEASVYGYIGNEAISRGSRSHQSIFVNKRFIKNRFIITAVENAFKSFLPINKFPFFVLFLDIYPELIDVNIHPTKSEVKFSDERKIFKLIFDAVHSALRRALEDSFMLPEEKETSTKDDSYENLSYLSKDILISEPVLSNERGIYENSSKEVNGATLDNKDEYPLKLKEENTSKDTVFKEKNIISYGSDADLNKNQDNYSKVEIPADLKSDSSTIEDIKLVPKLPPIKIIGQFNRTYIIGEYNRELYLIDQHAAHEKMLFERYKKEIKNRTILSQPLLIPLVLELSHEDFAFYLENKDIFKNSGFNIEIFGDNTLNIKECPYILGKADLKDFFVAILNDIKNLGSGSAEDVKYNKIAQMSCKKAVKANEELTIDEMKHLIDEVKYMEDPYTCPHGRPTIIKFTLYEIEKRFKRIQ
ncbi:MAG: DNA mismatch repair endonuclease MutL [Clostridium sp.]|uniref:DNA mismatch repair endonuclease MutL n=1 Tax=Clostridium sp. TaxID=1506 RepID=UPI002A904CC8|nr:DNA mismatch repair endonuclease MutL [Clostridium sp.]MDY5098209.1 DNA mismatch repair endonuclease MutL [Clostridium sp.]